MMKMYQPLSKMNILIVEDDEDQAFLEKEKLESPFEDSRIEVVPNATECLKRDFSNYHLILVDMNLPDTFGLDLLQQIQTVSDVPVIIVTGESDISLAIHALKAGAYDYVLKSSNAFEVLPVVAENAIRNYRTKKESESLREQLFLSERLASIGRLASGVAHELNNPLTAIVGFSELLLMQAQNGLKAKLEKIRESAFRCKKIVEDLLSFAREHKSEKKMVNVNELMESALSIGKNLIKMFNIKIDRHFGDPPPSIHAEAFHMQQVFLNIIFNACHAMEHAETKILSIRTKTEAQTVLITFTDTGHGIPEENLKRIFDPFFTTKDVGKGSGLGLSICYGIIQEHTGQIHAERPPGGGATFVIELPKASPSSLDLKKESVFREDSYSFGNLSILIVEDEESICDYYREVLEGPNNTIHYARSGREAFERVTDFDYDLIILDLRMPEMDGMQFYHFIQKRKPDLLDKILICTGDVMSQDIKDFLQKIRNRVLNKPFSLVDLKEAVWDIVKA